MKPLYYMASTIDHAPRIVSQHRAVLLAVPAIKKQIHIDRIHQWVSEGVNVMIDSGVYEVCAVHARAHDISHNAALALAPDSVDGFEELYEKYVRVAKQLPAVDMLVEIDIGGRANKIPMRARVEAEGLTVTPVCHPLIDGWDYLDELAERYPKICIGNVVNLDQGRRTQVMAYLIKWKKSHRDTWLHLLGVTPTPALVAMPLDSCDSSTWSAGVRWFSSWRSVSLCNRQDGYFGRDMAYRRRGGSEVYATAIKVIATDEDCSARSMEHYCQMSEAFA